MPKDISREPEVAIGRIRYQWRVKEYESHQRGRRWYIIMGVAGLLLVLYAVVVANYLFALIIVLFGIVTFLHSVQTPLEVPFAITESGLVLGRKYYPYSELQNFWIIYQPPQIKNLYFSPRGWLKHRLQVPLLDYDPRPIREYLGQFLEEDLEQEEEPLSDRLGRLLQLH